MRSGADRRVADRVPYRPGRWGSRADSGVAGAGHARLHPRPAATSGGHLGRSGRRGRRTRAHARRSDRRNPRLALGVLRQPSHRPVHHRRRTLRVARVIRPRHAHPRSPRRGPRRHCRRTDVLRRGQHRGGRLALGSAPSASSSPVVSLSRRSSSTSVARRPRSSISNCSRSTTSGGPTSRCSSSAPRSLHCSWDRSCSSPRSGVGRFSKPASESPRDPSSSVSSPPASDRSQAGSASDPSCSSEVCSTQAAVPTDSSCSDPNRTTSATTSRPWCSAGSASGSCSPALQRRGPGTPAQPPRRGRRRPAGGPPIRRHVRCRAHHRVPRRGHRHPRGDVRLRPDLVVDRHRRTRDVSTCAPAPHSRHHCWRRQRRRSRITGSRRHRCPMNSPHQPTDPSAITRSPRTERPATDELSETAGLVQVCAGETIVTTPTLWT